MNALSGIRYGAELTSAAQRYNLDPKLLAAVAAQETGGPGQNSGANIVGDGGHGHGLMQIDDRWHSFASTSAAMDPQASANYAAGLLSNLLQQYGGNVKEALSAYNAGSPNATGTTTDWGNGQVLGYADSVLQHYQQISALTGAFGGGATAGGATQPGGGAAAPLLGDSKSSQLAGSLGSLLGVGSSSLLGGAGSLLGGSAAGAIDPATAIAALGSNISALTGQGSAASSGALGSLLGSSSLTASGTSGTGSSSSTSADAAALIQQMGQDNQQTPSSTPPYISWNQISNSSSQVSAQADSMMANLGDPADGTNAANDN